MASNQRSEPSGRTDLLREFKGDLRIPLRLHPLEKVLLITVALNVCSLPWMLGGMRTWAQLISLGLSLVAFGLALIPRIYDKDLVRGDAFRFYPHRKLLCWPVWWIGLIFFGYVLIQALNPAWEFVQMEKSWGMRSIDHIEWLPTGMRTPFEMMNPWRQIIIWAIPFLTVCAVWVGFTRRKSVISLLTAIVGNATVLAVVGIVARQTEPGKILWLVDGIPNYCFSSFIYKNHAGSFFALAVTLSLALAVWHHASAGRHSRRSSPVGVFLFAALVLSVAVLQTYSRAAILIMGSFLLLFGVVAGFRLVRRGTALETPLLLAAFCIGFAAFIIIGGQLVNSERTLDQIRALTNEKQLDRSVVSRQIAWEAGYEMSKERPIFGWGAGGFRFLFPKYQLSRPQIIWTDQERKRGFMLWEHAHNDYLQLLIETGKLGVGIVFLSILVGFINFIRSKGWRNKAAVSLLGTMGVTLVHASVDFPMQNPSVLTTFSTAVILAFTLPILEHHGA